MPLSEVWGFRDRDGAGRVGSDFHKPLWFSTSKMLIAEGVDDPLDVIPEPPKQLGNVHALCWSRPLPDHYVRSDLCVALDLGLTRSPSDAIPQQFRAVFKWPTWMDPRNLPTSNGREFQLGHVMKDVGHMQSAVLIDVGEFVEDVEGMLAAGFLPSGLERLLPLNETLRPFVGSADLRQTALGNQSSLLLEVPHLGFVQDGETSSDAVTTWSWLRMSEQTA